MESKSQDPLGLPNGSVRAILAILLVGITAAVLFIPVAEDSNDVKAGIARPSATGTTSRRRPRSARRRAHTWTLD